MQEKLRQFIEDQSLLVKILGFFIFMIVMTTIIGITNSANLNRINNQIQSISQVSTPGLTKAATLKSIVAREEAEAIDFVMTQVNPAERWQHIQHFRELNRSFNTELQQLEKIADTPETKNKLYAIKQKHQDFAYIANTMFTRSIDNKNAVVRELYPNYKAVALEMQAISDQFYTYYSEQVRTTENTIFHQAKSSQLTSFALVSFGILTGLVLMPMLAWVIRGPIASLIDVTDTLATGELRVRANAARKDELGALATSVNQMAESMACLINDITNTVQGLIAASQKLNIASSKSTGVADELQDDIAVLEGQARQYTEKVHDLSEELFVITNEVQNVSRRSGDVQRFVENFATTARRSGANSEIAMEQMIFTEAKVTEMGTAIASFRNYAKEIVKITQVISGFAKATNMLALNASIEAAKAGESGKGFAVVAEEIRKLANDSTSSVNEIAQLIGKIQVEAEISVGTVSEGIEAITKNRYLVGIMAKDLAAMEKDVAEIVRKLKQVTCSMGTIQNSTTSFNQWIDDITTYADLTITNTVNARKKINEQMNVARTLNNQANDLNQLAEALSAQINKFKVGDGCEKTTKHS